MVEVFISYRRKDCLDVARGIHSALNRSQGARKVKAFCDLDLKPGMPWQSSIDAQLEACSVMLVLIGPRWRGRRWFGLTKPRIMMDNDMVRMEVRIGLRRGIRIIPILVDREDYPKRASIPSDLHGLSKWHYSRFYKKQNWGDQCEAIRKLLHQPAPVGATNGAGDLVATHEPTKQKSVNRSLLVIGLLLLSSLIGWGCWHLFGGKDVDITTQNEEVRVPNAPPKDVPFVESIPAFVDSTGDVAHQSRSLFRRVNSSLGKAIHAPLRDGNLIAGLNVKVTIVDGDGHVKDSTSLLSFLEVLPGRIAEGHLVAELVSAEIVRYEREDPLSVTALAVNIGTIELSGVEFHAPVSVSRFQKKPFEDIGIWSYPNDGSTPYYTPRIWLGDIVVRLRPLSKH